MFGIRIRKAQDPVSPRRRGEWTTVGPVAEPKYGFVGYYTRSRHDTGDGEDRERMREEAARVGRVTRRDRLARVPVEVDGRRFVVEAPLGEDGGVAGYVRVLDDRRRVIYQVLRETGSVRQVVDQFLDFYLGLYPRDDHPADTDAEHQIARMNEHDVWQLGYPEGHGSPNPRFRAGVRIAAV